MSKYIIFMLQYTPYNLLTLLEGMCEYSKISHSPGGK